MMCRQHITLRSPPAETIGPTPWHYSSRRTKLDSPFRNQYPNVPVKRNALAGDQSAEATSGDENQDCRTESPGTAVDEIAATATKAVALDRQQNLPVKKT